MRTEFARPAEEAAQRLLGCLLVRLLESGERLAGIIVETEAYIGIDDHASHAFGGRRTPRNESMYGAPGTAYIYFTYGMHYCFSVACGARNEPPAVLIRALEPVEGEWRMAEHRGLPEQGGSPAMSARQRRNLCSGPAKLCQAMAIDRRLDGVDLVTSKVLFVERRLMEPAGDIVSGPRIGLGAVGEWATVPLRYWIKQNTYVSR